MIRSLSSMRSHLEEAMLDGKKLAFRNIRVSKAYLRRPLWFYFRRLCDLEIIATKDAAAVIFIKQKDLWIGTFGVLPKVKKPL